MSDVTDLSVRLDNFELLNLEEKHARVFWAGAKRHWIGEQIRMAQGRDELHAQVDAWIKEGQAVGEYELTGTAQLGAIAKDADKAAVRPTNIRDEKTGRIVGGGSRPSGEEPKWKRLGFKTGKAMEQAEFLANHPKEVKEVIAEAKAENDLPSKGAVKSKVRMRAAEERAKWAEESARQSKQKAEDKQVRQRPQYVADFLDVQMQYVKALETALVYAQRIPFAPETKQFISTRYERIHKLEEELIK